MPDMQPLPALLDGNVLDYLLENPPALDRLRAARAAGSVILLATHVLPDELIAMTHDVAKAEKWEKLEAIRDELGFEMVPTTGFVLDVSRLDEGILLSDEGAKTFRLLSVDNPKQHAEDALLALTANAHGAILVTEDQGLRGRARRQGIEVMGAAAFIERLPAV